MRLMVMAVAWILGLAAPAAAIGQPSARVALLIGNVRYQHMARLGNPVNDVTVVSGALRQAGFATIEARTNLTAAEMRDTLRSFAALAATADVALIYYGGHATSLDGVSYLIPIDFDPRQGAAGLRAAAISETEAGEAVAASRTLRILVLDACRDVAGSSLSPMSTASGTRPPPPPGFVTIYSVEYLKPADDGATVDSPFAEAFARQITAPALSVETFFDRLREDLSREADGSRRIFSPGGPQPPMMVGSQATVRAQLTSGSAMPVIDRSPAAKLDQEGADWQLCPVAPLRDPCDRYIARYPKGRYVAQARARIADLDRIVTAKSGRKIAGDTEVGALGLILRDAPRRDGSILVVRVDDDSPALGQLIEGDVITAINAASVTNDLSIEAAIMEGLTANGGRSVKFVVERAGVTNVVVIRFPASSPIDG